MNTRILVMALSVTASAALVGCPDSEPVGDDDTTDDTPIEALHLIPVPVEVSGDVGYLHLSEASRIAVIGDVLGEAELLAEVLRRSTGFPFEVVSDTPAPGDIVLEIDSTLESLGEQGYRVEVDASHATVRAPAAAGVFYGCQTLRQLMPAAVESPGVVEDVDWSVPMVTVEDWPRFPWRGMMLDVARHFFTPEEVMGLIDVAAHYKIDRFHLHLTDDQGWRIEILSWPDLTGIGGSFEIGGGEGGYYTQAEYAAIVEYAAARHVTVVPEIDMPGHCTAALASYGELNEDGEPAEPMLHGGISDESLWVEGDITFVFLEDVLGELAAMTPGPYLHIGGDESEGTDDDDYGWFIRDVQEIVDGLGKTMIGWDEIATAPLATPVLVQHWHDEENALDAVALGAQIIASPAEHAYLDMVYDKNSPVGTFWAGPTDVQDGYEWDPVIAGLGESDVAGLEAPLWTETVEVIDDVEFLVFPRLLGYAEIGWSPVEGRSWEEYRDRLAAHDQRMQHWGLDYYESPLVDW
jgi:hexosaminidase